MLVVLAAATAAIPAAADERPPEPSGGARGAPTTAQERSSEAQAKTQATPSAHATPPLRFAIDDVDPGLEVRVVPRSERVSQGTGVASCTQDCELKLQKGAYTLIAIRGDEQNTQEVDLTSSQVLRVGKMDGVARTMGTAMGITGIVVGALGAFVTVAMIAAPPPAPDGDEDTQAKMGVFFLGLGGLVVGTGLAIGGFAIAASNHAPSIDLRPMPMSRPPAGAAGANISLSRQF
jgi:hypothetical protein